MFANTTTTPHFDFNLFRHIHTITSDNQGLDYHFFQPLNDPIILQCKDGTVLAAIHVMNNDIGGNHVKSTIYQRQYQSEFADFQCLLAKPNKSISFHLTNLTDFRTPTQRSQGDKWSGMININLMPSKDLAKGVKEVNPRGYNEWNEVTPFTTAVTEYNQISKPYKNSKFLIKEVLKMDENNKPKTTTIQQDEKDTELLHPNNPEKSKCFTVWPTAHAQIGCEDLKAKFELGTRWVPAHHLPWFFIKTKSQPKPKPKSGGGQLYHRRGPNYHYFHFNEDPTIVRAAPTFDQNGYNIFNNIGSGNGNQTQAFSFGGSGLNVNSPNFSIDNYNGGSMLQSARPILNRNVQRYPISVAQNNNDNEIYENEDAEDDGASANQEQYFIPLNESAPVPLNRREINERSSNNHKRDRDTSPVLELSSKSANPKSVKRGRKGARSKSRSRDRSPDVSAIQSRDSAQAQDSNIEITQTVQDHLIASSTITELVDGETGDVNTIQTGCDYHFNLPAPLCRVGISVQAELVFREQPYYYQTSELKPQFDEAIEMDKAGKYKEFIDKETKHDKNKDAKCYICLDDDFKPDVLFFSCGHNCIHAKCMDKTIDKCGLCRAIVNAQLKI